MVPRQILPWEILYVTWCYVYQYHYPYSFLAQMTSPASSSCQTTLHAQRNSPQWKPKNVSSVGNNSNYNCCQFILSTVRTVHNNSAAQTAQTNSTVWMRPITSMAWTSPKISRACISSIMVDLERLRHLTTQDKPATWMVHDNSSAQTTVRIRTGLLTGLQLFRFQNPVTHATVSSTSLLTL